MSYPPMPALAGQRMTATQVNALSRFVSTLAMASVSNSASETIVGTVTIPATDPGLALNGGYQMWFFGSASDTGTPTLEFRVRLGSVTGTVLFDSGVISCRTASGMFAHLVFNLMITLAGSSGTADCWGQAVANLNAATGSAVYGGARAVTVNTTAAVTLVVTAQWGTASASNTMTGDIGSLDRI